MPGSSAVCTIHRKYLFIKPCHIYIRSAGVTYGKADVQCLLPSWWRNIRFFKIHVHYKLDGLHFWVTKNTKMHFGCLQF